MTKAVMSAKARTITLLLGGIAVILSILALQLITAGELTLHEQVGEASITFTADRRLVAAPGACVTVRWHVEYIKAVFIDDEPTVGDGQHIDCIDETTMPTLRVQFSDNTERSYPLQVAFLTTQPSTWLLVAAALLFALALVYVALLRPTTGTAPAPTKPRRSWVLTIFAGIGLLTVGLIFVAILLELGLRVYFTQNGSRYERDAYLYSRAEIEQREDDEIPLPMLEYGLSPDRPGQNALGYRGEEVQVPKPDGVYRIVAMGGSSTYGTPNPYDESYPYYLQQVLRDEYGETNVEVVNDGVPGYTSWHNMIDLSTRVLTLDPDLVILYIGLNDVTPRELPPDCYSGLSPFLGLYPDRHLRAQPDELSPFVLYRFVAVNLGWMPNPAEFEGGFIDSRLTCGAEGKGDPAENVANNPPVYFERNVRSMIGIARAHNLNIMFVSSAYDHTSPYALPYWQAAIDEHNAIMKQIAQENGVLFLDYEALAPTDTALWSDSMHFKPDGNLQQARTIARFLVDHDVFSSADAAQAP